MFRVLLSAIVTSFLLLAATAQADSVVLTASFACVGAGACEQQSTHYDAAPFKGAIDLTVTNTGTQAWGDFHFFIFQAGLETVQNVHFDETTSPTSTQSGLSWVIDNVTVGATMDLFFYSNPVLPGQTANFTVYTDNTTDNVSFFGVGYYPTPVPEPGTALLLGLGTLFLAGSRRSALRKSA